MAARFPTFADLGINDPRVTTPGVTYAATDPGAAGLAIAGRGLQEAGAGALRIGNEMEEKRQALNDATATTDFINRIVPLRTQISLETDPAKIGELRTQYNDMLQTSAAAIDDPQRRALWLSRHSNALLHAQGEADERITHLDRQNYGVGIERQLDNLLDNAAKSSDPKALDVAKIAGQQLIDAAAQYGLPPQRVYEWQKQFEHKLESAGTGMRVGGAVQRALGLAPIGAGIGEGHVAPQTERVSFAREYAASKGVNPDAVVATMQGEGLGKYTGDNGTSFGDFQLHVGGGMGDQAVAAGIDVRDPRTWKEQTKFAIDQMAANRSKGAAWYQGQWHGAPAWAAAAFHKSDGQPAPAGAEAQEPRQNRTGMPPLADVWRNIVSDPSLRNEQEQLAAFQKARITYDAMEADAARAERLAAGAEKQRVEQRTNEIYADVYSGNPQITAQQIATDPAFNSQPDRRRHMIDLINDPPGSKVPPSQSYAAAQSLIDRIRLPDGDPNKINDIGQIYDSMRLLNRSDFEFVKKEFDGIRTPGGEKLMHRKGDFVKAIAPAIDKSNPLMGKIDQSGKAQLYAFEWALDQKIEEYRKAGKNPADLLDPSKPDFMGKPETIAPYQKTMQQSIQTIREQVRGITGQAPAATAPIPPVGAQPQTVTTRLPGESPADYLKRIGAAPPGAR